MISIHGSSLNSFCGLKSSLMFSANAPAGLAQQREQRGDESMASALGHEGGSRWFSNGRRIMETVK